MVDYEYEHEDDYGPRVLWGRIAFYVVGLLLAFLAGRCVFGGGEGDSAELTAARRQVQALASDKAVLEQRLAASQQAANEGEDGGGQGGQGDGGDGGGDGGGATEGQTEPEGQDPVDSEGQTYTVQSGDTLIDIAEEFYGEASKWTLIRDANNLDAPLQVGQEIVIPPEE